MFDLVSNLLNVTCMDKKNNLRREEEDYEEKKKMMRNEKEEDRNEPNPQTPTLKKL